MRTFPSMLAAIAVVVLVGNASAKRPEPTTCPEDIGTALAETCPCDGTLQPDLSVQPWRNHGQYVRCVVHYRNALRKAACFADDSTRRALARCAARSTCGKPALLRCCSYELGACSDPAPGDLMAAGVCSNDAVLACDTDADCTKSSARLVRDADACTADGGTIVDGGSVCEACPTPPAP